MEMQPLQPVLQARSPEAVPVCAPDRTSPNPSGQGQASPSTRLQLVASPGLTLAQHPGPMPDDWQSALDQLAHWLDLDVHHLPARSVSGLSQMMARASQLGSRPGAPVFAPWRASSPVLLDQSVPHHLPRVSWVASYLFDPGVGKPSRHSQIDIQLMSPLGSVCLADGPDEAPLPRSETLQAMIEAARSERRDRLAIITDARSRNAMIRQMLLLDRKATRGTLKIDIVTIEDALCSLMRSPARWDAIITLPGHRSLVFAMLAEIAAIRSPLPMLWHGRDLCMVAAEALDECAGDLPLNAPLLVQTLALAARHAGLDMAARRLVQGAAQLWDCGMITPGHGAAAPYVTEIGDQEFIDQICHGARVSRRPLAGWRAVASDDAAPVRRSPARLSLVG